MKNNTENTTLNISNVSEMFYVMVDDKNTFYKYDIEKMEKTCEDRGGINRFNTDINTINCWCNDGSHHRIESK